jgi:hypothetical protein
VTASSTPRPAPPAGETFREILRGLDAARESAFATADASLLSRAYVAGSAPMEQDAARVAALGARGWRLLDLRFGYDSVRVVSMYAGRAVLDVVDRHSSADVVDGDGRVVEAVPARGPRRWTVTLRHTGRGWRIAAEVAA